MNCAQRFLKMRWVDAIGTTLPITDTLTGKQLIEISKSFHFNRVARGVAEEHRRLLTRLALETDLRRDLEFCPRRSKPVGQRLSIGQREDYAEMRHRHPVAINRIGASIGARAITNTVRDNLMPEEIEIDPVIRTPPFRAAHNAAPKCARLSQIAHRKGEVERAQAH